MSPLEVLLTRLDPEVPVPGYSHAGDAGADLVTTQDLVLRPGERAVVGTGIAIAMPAGYAGFVHPRSGLAAQAGLGIVNAPGTIDAGYRGELRVCLVNHDLHESVVLHRMDRIAQLVVQRVERAVFREVTTLPKSSRGADGYGSTGTAVFANGSVHERQCSLHPAGRDHIVRESVEQCSDVATGPRSLGSHQVPVRTPRFPPSQNGPR
jgi:dUTP pyrophosphatase